MAKSTKITGVDQLCPGEQRSSHGRPALLGDQEQHHDHDEGRSGQPAPGGVDYSPEVPGGKQVVSPTVANHSDSPAIDMTPAQTVVRARAAPETSRGRLFASVQYATPPEGKVVEVVGAPPASCSGTDPGWAGLTTHHWPKESFMLPFTCPGLLSPANR